MSMRKEFTPIFATQGGDNPEAREELEALAHNKAFKRIHEKLRAELSRKREALERYAEEGADVSSNVTAGELKALKFALGLAQQMYRDAGGKRQLFNEVTNGREG